VEVEVDYRGSHQGEGTPTNDAARRRPSRRSQGGGG